MRAATSRSGGAAVVIPPGSGVPVAGANAGSRTSMSTCSGHAGTVAAKLDVVGAEIVEVIPTAVGSADITALAADAWFAS
jgi:hypothetical protein